MASPKAKSVFENSPSNWLGYTVPNLLSGDPQSALPKKQVERVQTPYEGPMRVKRLHPVMACSN